jgi:hypothetical protein
VPAVLRTAEAGILNRTNVLSTASLFAGDSRAADGLNQAAAERQSVFPRLMPVEMGTWEARIALSADETALERVFGVMSLFGFGTYL